MSFIKKIHYCWIGGDVPASVRSQVHIWEQLCPDFEFVEWNNTNVSYSDFEDFSFCTRFAIFNSNSLLNPSRFPSSYFSWT